MFKSLGRVLRRREDTLIRTEHGVQVTTGAVEEFFTNILKVQPPQFPSYQLRDGTLTIWTPSKTMANELSLHLAELTVFLRERKVTVSTVIVR